MCKASFAAASKRGGRGNDVIFLEGLGWIECGKLLLVESDDIECDPLSNDWCELQC